MKPDANAPRLKAMLDGDNQHSLVRLVEGESVEKAVKRVPADLWELEEKDIRDKAKPTKTDYALRLALWNEFRLAQGSGRTIKANRIFEGICTPQHWYQNVLTKPEKVAWLFSPLQEYEQSLEPLLVRVAERYDEIINMNVYDEDGKPNPALVKLVLKASELVEARLRGAAIQRVESKTLSVSLRKSSNSSEMSMEEIERRLADLRKQDRLGLVSEAKRDKVLDGEGATDSPSMIK